MEEAILPAAVVLLLVGAGVVFLRRARRDDLFRLVVRGGHAEVVHGTVAPALLGDMCDILEQGGVKEATIRAVRSRGRSHLVVRGVDPAVAQRLRNIYGVR